MAKTTAPLLSFDAGGQIAKTQVYSKWRGIPYVRQYVTPANPNTSGQQMTRGVFRWSQGVWKFSDGDFQAPWVAFSKGKPLTDRNAFTQANVKALRGESDLTDYVGSPGALGGLPLASIAITPGAGQLSIAAVLPALPAGWTMNALVAAALPNNDPETSLVYTSVTNKTLTTPWTSVVITGLTAAQEYLVAAWPVINRPDTSLAYGPSITSTGTPT
jgi:hypothetical protein